MEMTAAVWRITLVWSTHSLMRLYPSANLVALQLVLRHCLAGSRRDSPVILLCQTNTKQLSRWVTRYHYFWAPTFFVALLSRVHQHCCRFKACHIKISCCEFIWLTTVSNVIIYDSNWCFIQITFRCLSMKCSDKLKFPPSSSAAKPRKLGYACAHIAFQPPPDSLACF